MVAAPDRRLSLLLQLGLMLLIALASTMAVAQQGSYSLGAGDKIKIQVFGEDDLTIETLVGDSGSVSYPFLGVIKVKGLTPDALESQITKRLKGPYLVDPEVTVSILEYRNFYVNGLVEKPGGFPFQPGMTVRKAISLAGGFEERANKDKILVVSGENPGALPKPIGLNAHVGPGDIITVERSFF